MPEVRDVLAKSLPEGVHVDVPHTVLLAHFLQDRGDGRVMVLRPHANSNTRRVQTKIEPTSGRQGVWCTTASRSAPIGSWVHAVHAQDSNPQARPSGSGLTGGLTIKLRIFLESPIRREVVPHFRPPRSHRSTSSLPPYRHQ